MKPQLSSIILFLIVCNAFFACTPVTNKPELVVNYNKLKESLKTRTDPLNPAFFKDTHVALIYEIDSIIIDSLHAGSLVTKTGTMPSEFYPGSFKVVYLDKDEGELGSYTMWSPFYQRVESQGGGIGIRRVTKGRFEVRLPSDNRIVTVILSEGTNQLIKSDVEFLFENL
jgi:hypothetical protein